MCHFITEIWKMIEILLLHGWDSRELESNLHRCGMAALLLFFIKLCNV